MIRSYGPRARFAVQDLGASPLAERFGVDKYPAIFVDDALIARPEDFYAWGGPPTGKYLPWKDPANRLKFQRDLRRMIDVRLYAMMVNLLPILNPAGGPAIGSPRTVSFGRARQAAADAFRHQVQAASDAAGNPVTMLITSPMTDFAAAIETDPAILGSISEVVWMGGTINAGGNIDTGIAPGANPNAEWNAYWDPQSVLTVLQSGVKLSMFPLDITNSTLLAPSTLQQYFLPQASSSVMIDLVCQMYALVAFQGGYSFWDTLTAAYLGMPSLFSFQSTSLNIDVNPQSPTFGQFAAGTGFPVNLCTTFAPGQTATTFYEYLAKQLASLTIE